MRYTIHLLILCVLIMSCKSKNINVHRYIEFKSVQINNDYPSNFICSDESEAMKIVGFYIYQTITEGHFPDDSVTILSGFRSACVKPADFDSVFSFKNYNPGGYHEEPCRIEVLFRNGKTIRFCFFSLFFDISRLDCVACPENAKDIIEKSAELCK